jgi:DNA polymerase I
MAKQERLFLLDGMALAYRAYYSFITRPLINSKGRNTGAIYGFTTALIKILIDESPEHIAVVFDTKEPTFRHKRYPEYKATRQEMPEDLAAQLAPLKDMVRAFNVPSIELPGYEADDIIGTLARRAEKEKVLTMMVTPDKDYMQLVSPLIKIYRPGKGDADVEIIEEPGVLEKFGVTPDKVIEVLALIGDKSDNIPGVPGVGEKTAIPLIQHYGSVKNLYKHIDEIPQKGVQKKLNENRDLAFLSLELVTIDVKTPVQVDFHELRANPPDMKKLIPMFGELEFRTLGARLRDLQFKGDKAPSAAPPASPAVEPEIAEQPVTDITTDQHTYHCVGSEAELKALAGELAKAEEFVLDTETTSTNPMLAQLVGLSFCVTPRTAYYVPVQMTPLLRQGEMLFAAPAPTTTSGLPLDVVVKALKPVLENFSIRKIGQNIKYDALVLRNHGILLQGISYDSMIASYILRADGQHNLDALAMEAFRYKMVSYEDMVGKGKQQKHISEIPLEVLADYAAEDADFTMRIYQQQRGKLEELQLTKLCNELEFPLIPVLAAMEYAGVALDTEYLGIMSRDLEKQLRQLEKSIHTHAGEEFNINSTQQLGKVLFEKLGLQTGRKTKTGYSTDAGVLEELKGSHPIIEQLLDYRQLTKLKSTYIDALPTLVHPVTKRVHTSYNQAVAATGRLSSSDPNLQNIPIRSDVGRAIRKAFVPRTAGNVLLSADYSQIELRVMAHIAEDKGMIEAFENDEDIHATTAAKVFGVPQAEVSRDMRRKAKEVNFGIMYGIGPFGLAGRLEISQAESREIINRYFERFPNVKKYIADTIASARETGYVSTLLGRRRYLPDVQSRNQAVRGNAERAAINMPIQGTAADMIKLAMIRIHHALAKRKSSAMMLLQVHDELVFEVAKAEVEELSALVIREMQEALPLRVPIKVEVGTGANWLEAH